MASPASCNVVCNNGKTLGYRFCHKCLRNRYGEDTDTVAELADWICPKCRGICNCSICIGKKGQLLPISSFGDFSSISEICETLVGGSSAGEPIDLDEDQEITDRIEMEMDKEIDELKNRVLSRITKSNDIPSDQRTPKEGQKTQIEGSSCPGSSPGDAIDVDELHELQMKKEMERDREIERLRVRIAATDAEIKRLKAAKALIVSDQSVEDGLISTH